MKVYSNSAIGFPEKKLNFEFSFESQRFWLVCFSADYEYPHEKFWKLIYVNFLIFLWRAISDAFAYMIGINIFWKKQSSGNAKRSIQ